MVSLFGTSVYGPQKVLAYQDLKAHGVVVVDTSSVTAIQLEAALHALSVVTQFVPPDSRATHAPLHAIANPKSDAAKNRASTEDAGLLHDLSQAKVSCVDALGCGRLLKTTVVRSSREGETQRKPEHFFGNSLELKMVIATAMAIFNLTT